MAKKFRLSKSFFAGSSSGSCRLSKAAKGKGIAKSLDVDTERDLILDDMSPEDFGSDWLMSCGKKSVAIRTILIRRIWILRIGGFLFNPVGVSLLLLIFILGNLYGLLLLWKHVRRLGPVVWELCPTTLVAIVSSGCAATKSKIDCCVPASGSGSSSRFVWFEGPSKKLKSCGGGLFRHRPKKVIMGRDFLLVSHRCLRDLDKRFRFFHMASLSAVEVKVQEPSLIVSQPCSLDGHVSQEVCVDVLEGDTPLVSVSDLPSPSYMEVVKEIPSSPSSCVTDSSASDHHKLSLEDTPSNGVEDGFQNSALGPRNLRAKRVVALWRYRMEDCDSAFVGHSGNQKQMKVNSVAGSNGCDKKFSHPFRSKRKQERVYDVFDVAGVGVVMFSVRICCLSFILGVSGSGAGWQSDGGGDGGCGGQWGDGGGGNGCGGVMVVVG
ncbi:hypothetical protein RHGRI_002158 [Rhododendron griersonianum]|uniref:Uncharacterized protein n=1 Tax=Rhododendron griersonianum TaxID=479676 RepID=A0AAV6LRT1_9ERIC|nr:hypothetical protein RHGRI_002158 [Rhododendron griersonianum]